MSLPACVQSAVVPAVIIGSSEIATDRACFQSSASLECRKLGIYDQFSFSKDGFLATSLSCLKVPLGITDSHAGLNSLN
jgi:hypothetical protein